MAVATCLAAVGLATCSGAWASCGGPCTQAQLITGLARPPAWAIGRPVHFEPPSTAASAYTATEPVAGAAAGLYEGFEEEAEGIGPLLYHEASSGLQHNPKVYLIFWGSNFETTTPGIETHSMILKLFEGLSGSAYQGLLTQYFDATSRLGATVTLGGVYMDGASPTPPIELNDAYVREEVSQAIAVNGWTAEHEAQFLVFSAPESSFEPGYPNGCAYHSTYTTTPILYGFIPYQGDSGLAETCISRGNPSKNPVYKTSKSAAHEYAEIATDPGGKVLPTWNTNGLEVADLCETEADFELPGGAWAQNLYDDYEHACKPADASPPHVYTLSESASEVASTTVRLHGTVNAEGLTTNYHFEYGTSAEKYGFSTSEASAGSGVTNQAANQLVSGLSPNTTYHFRLTATNSTGTAHGVDLTFTTAPPAGPTAETKAATNVGVTVATLNGSVNPRGAETTYHFEYGQTTAYGAQTPEANAGSGITSAPVLTVASGLKPATTYHFRLVAKNANGTTNGKDLKFTTHQWTLQAITGPEGSEVEAGPVLESVSCASATACIAAGWYQSSSTSSDVALAEGWNGSEWKRQTVPGPAGAKAVVLKGISCPVSGTCFAVGAYESSSGTWVSSSENWNGLEWKVLSTPNPEGAIASELTAVDCRSTTPAVCTAVGRYETSGGQWRTLAERWNGTAWSFQATPNPPVSADNELRSVSCGSTAACTAVGIQVQENGSGHLGALTETWNGKEWKIRASAVPAPEGEETSFSGYYTLAGVSCPSAKMCIATGTDWHEGTGVSGPFAESWNGTAWVLQSVPLPEAGNEGNLRAVSCTTSKACSAAGSYAPSGAGAGAATLVAAWNGSEWVLQPTPNPEGALESRLDGISCATATACTATGAYKSGAGLEHLLAEGYH